MTSYANATTPTRAASTPAKTYWKLTAPVLAAVAVLGFLLNALGLGDLLGGFLTFDWAHNAVHLVLALAAFGLAYAADASLARVAALVVGGVYVALALVGFLSGSAFGVGGLVGLHLELGENLIHAALGAWGLYAGMAR